jgi:lysophospholipase L1-like esterase
LALVIVHVARLALAPVLYTQARWMHKTVPLLPEPDGVRSGVSGEGARTVRLLIAGDSSAIGVGASTQEHGLAIPLTRTLATHLDARIHWQLIGETGLTSEGVFQKLTASEVLPADVALVIVGANDITREVRLARALRHRHEMVMWLRERIGVAHVVFPSLPEMQHFPAIPQPLAWYAGLHARRNNRAQERWARSHPWARHADISGLTRAELMATDGYHPSPSLYALVAARLAAYIAKLHN